MNFLTLLNRGSMLLYSFLLTGQPDNTYKHYAGGCGLYLERIAFILFFKPSGQMVLQLVRGGLPERWKQSPGFIISPLATMGFSLSFASFCTMDVTLSGNLDKSVVLFFLLIDNMLAALFFLFCMQYYLL